MNFCPLNTRQLHPNDLQLQGVNCGVGLPNDYTHAKLKKLTK